MNDYIDQCTIYLYAKLYLEASIDDLKKQLELQKKYNLSTDWTESQINLKESELKALLKKTYQYYGCDVFDA